MSVEPRRPDPDLIADLKRKIALKQEELAASPAAPGLVPLIIACRMSSCRYGKHCLDFFRRPRAADGPIEPGTCRDCGAHIADLPGRGGRRYGDPDAVLDTCVAQQSELIRAHYWHVPIDLWAYKRAQRLGRRELYRRAEERVNDALTRTDAWSGRQTPYRGDVISYAQHAVAACCRQCAAYWHGLHKDAAPSRAQVRHVVESVWAYLDCRLVDLPDERRASVGVIKNTMLPAPHQVADLDARVRRTLDVDADPTGLVVASQSNLKLLDGRDHTGGFVTAVSKDHRNGLAAGRGT